MKKIITLMLFFMLIYEFNYSQSLGGVDLSRFVYGENQTKTSWFGDPNAEYNSGFYNNYTNLNMPYSTWWHMIISRHLNPTNNYQFQLASDFWGDNTYFRKVAHYYQTPWRRILNDGQDPFAANLNQNLRTSDNVSFTGISINGIVKAKKLVITQNGWPDYVFSSAYKLRPIAQVADYIQANKHLPDMPSAKDVEEKGLDIGKTQAALLKKIEELTLYIIKLEKNQKLLNEKLEQYTKKNKR